MTFTEYAAQHKITLLRDDITYIRKHVAGLSPKARRALLSAYVSIWCHSRDNCQNALQADNEGRRAANIYIRELK